MQVINRLKAVFNGGFSAMDRPQPIPGDLRIVWGQALILLVLASSRGQRCSLQKLHFLAHLSRAARLRDQTREVLARKREPAELSVRIEPWVNRAAAFATANGLVDIRDGKALSLTDVGKEAVKALRKAEVLSKETAFLDEVSPRATEKVVEKIMKMEQF